MPTIVELPDKTELEFPDGMDEPSMQQAISKFFPQFVRTEPATTPTPTPSISPTAQLAKSKLAFAPLAGQAVANLPDKPLLTLPEWPKGEGSLEEQITGQVYSKLKDFLGFMTSPKGVAVTGAAIAAPEVAGPIISAAMLPAAVEEGIGTVKSIGKGDIPGAAGHATGLVLTGAGVVGGVAQFLPRTVREVTAPVEVAKAPELPPEPEPAPTAPSAPIEVVKETPTKPAPIPEPIPELQAPKAPEPAPAPAPDTPPEISAPEAKAPEPTPPAKVEAPAAKEPYVSGVSAQDKGISQAEKEFRSTAEGQKAMANRASRIAVLNQMNEAIRKVDPKEAYDRALIEQTPDSQIDSMLESLRQDYNRLVAKPAAKPTTETGKEMGAPAVLAQKTELPQVGDDVTWTTGAGDMARSTVMRIRKLPNDTEPMADVDWFGTKRVPVSKLELVKKSSRRIAEEERAAKAAQPTAVAAKVEQKVKTVAKTEGQRSAKEVKSELVQRLEDASKEAPFNTADYFEGLYVYEARTLSEKTRLTDRPVEGTIPLKDWLDRSMTKKDKTLNRDTGMGGRFMQEALERKKVPKVTIEIPGDGTFTVWNTKDALAGLAKRAQRIPTTTTPSKGFSESKPTREQGQLWAEQAKVTESKPPETPPTGPGMVGLGAAAAEGEPGFMRSGEGATAMKYRMIDAERAKRGLEPIAKPESRTDQAVMDKAMAAVDHDPGLPERLVSELRTKPRPIEDWENHVLLLRKIDLRNEYAKTTREIAQAFEDGRMDDVTAARVRLTEWSDKLTKLEEASRLAGSERGRALRALRVMANEDYSLAAMESSLRAELGGRRLTDAELAKLEKLAKDYQDKSAALETQLATSEQARLEAVTRATLAEIARQSAEKQIPAPHIQKLIQRVGTTIHEAGQESREWLRGASFTISPEVMYHLSRVGADNIWTLGEDFGRWSTKMVEDIGERIKPHLQAVWEASKKLVEDTWDKSGAKVPQKAVALAKQTVKKGDTPELKQQKLLARLQERHAKGQSGLLAPVVQKLARTFVEMGVRGVEPLIDAVHEVIAPIFGPEWTRRQTMDVISGYGDYKALSKDQISRELRTLKSQMQQQAKLEDMAAGQAPLRTGIERREITSAESALIKLVNEAKRRGGYETTDPVRQLRTALDEVKKRTETRIADLERRMAEGDFSVRRLEPIQPDSELIAKQAQLAHVKKQFDRMKKDAELAGRKTWQKALDRFVRWERAFKLSSPVVFGKLSAAAMTRVAETATSELAGTALRLVPGIHAIAKQAPREGGALSIPAMAKALAKATTQGMKDAWETARRGAANLDVVYGEKIIDQDWANVFGQLHGMLKAPVKRFEFEYALAKRTEHAMRNGLDVTDPAVQIRLSTEALNDGYRAIFMQRGFSSDMFNQLVTLMEKTKKPGYQPAGEISARMARFLMPVVRVPANIVAETATGIYGVPVASMRTMFNVARGTLNKLDPVVADSIMRQFKKGSIGLGFMALGYFNPESIGGYDWREKRLPGEVKAGGFQVSGVDIPRWMTHAPWFELMQFGATIRRVKDQHVRGEEKGISEGMWAAGLGLLEETPFINEMLRVDKNWQSPTERARYWGELMRGALVPGIVQKAAQWSDREFGQTVQRKPETVWQNVQTGIPGLRQNVPERLQR